MQVHLNELARFRIEGQPRGIVSVCSAHPIVLRAALRHGRQQASTVLIEATCNQVNHLGGYTGMTPDDFASLVMKIAAEEGCPEKSIILGGDHLGPNPWRDRPAEEAMAEAEKMVAAYVEAGFRKIHLDASMGCKGEALALDDETTAHRAARLAAVAEASAKRAGGAMPVYVIGTEVPPPGGADHALTAIEPTAATAALKTIEVHRRVFAEAGLAEAFGRAIGLVVQPGVEFGNHNVIFYDSSKIAALQSVLTEEPQFVFEAHSTDYQGTGPLTSLVRDGFPILKVGPELTFVLREALYALDAIASDLLPDYGQRPLYQVMEALMLGQSGDWCRHYHGTEAEMRWLRHYSLSDRIRYYWASAEAQGAVRCLCAALRGQSVPLPLLWQHMPAALHFADAPLDPDAVLIWRVMKSLSDYHAACGVGKNEQPVSR
ncbi:class II D-tagatose-bisphosphate aldolase, non-catalytic subunit [Rhizobium hidalgonense]|uniref:Tagatose-bisphosphate aldolase n=1 Tax=Rhizobium hidalgonense TaxID=1538159 RepID=A0A2A6K9K7_9HYPH|nr:class II D-tagatose-bisphosphate aldolase, non-catalytic subunit [Rhizobium hidalgonense]MDR9775469.1 class II D-tagatose-bisphosphate aldolase, non-catalytic subunit [Rhizobium hidalgonense]MDR9812815.1 class II D-tagatose-bisphosphate aldolase, non-catalytic subunit [Rhizobium hidalgonense]MDR9821666.1 class II D-tagatose-bisphosphate aldolase, non-catalytic subunit [Rhizobium hidalgonense]PDT21576.1 tagatose-bisphosphate aldolase [Rhizobium hidalgonense]PON08229.1 tagatose-bisphosphate a